jgi:hypothetical protein
MGYFAVHWCPGVQTIERLPDGLRLYRHGNDCGGEVQQSRAADRLGREHG